MDIERFKLFNDWYGQEAGDRLLAMIGELLNKTQSEEGGLAGYMGGDDFVILLPDSPAVLRRLQEEITRYMKEAVQPDSFRPLASMVLTAGAFLSAICTTWLL